MNKQKLLVKELSGKDDHRMIASSNKRIAKNTVMLYTRMLLSMTVSLYTSRIVLNTLGVVDYGIYNIVGGIVTALAFMNGALSMSTSRFLTYELGKGNHKALKKTFSASLTIHFTIAMIVLIFAETIGLWYVQNKLVVLPGRQEAALWAYQFSIIASMIQLTQVPYNSTLIAHERMQVFAYIGIYDVFSKLFVVYLLGLSRNFDLLKVYSVLVVISSASTATIYRIYCKKQFAECAYQWAWDRNILTKMINFSGWSMLSNFSWIFIAQGSSLILNLFFGPAINAAQAIALQVNGAVSNFAYNFRTAINPQIIKLYANGQKQKMFTLVYRSGKYSYFILLFLILPLILETEYILKIWLKEIPHHSIKFTRLTLIYTLMQVFDASFVIVLQAIGRIKENAIIGTVLGVIILLPLTYTLIAKGYSPDSFYYLMVGYTLILSIVVKPYLLNKIADMKYYNFIIKMLFPVIIVTLTSIILPVLIIMYLESSRMRFVLVGIVSSTSIGLSVLYFGMSRDARVKIYKILLAYVKHTISILRNLF
jgi:O-antigen/teichoic acid export membrane protein